VSRYPRELSGGQKQRIGGARALAANTDVILMDEPFSALDPISREQLQDELVNLQSALHKTIVFVTHDMDEALKIADEIVLIKDGVIVQQDVPERILRYPANDFVKDFVGEKRFKESALLVATAADAITKPVTVSANRGLAECIRLMRTHRVNGLIVTDASGNYQGVVGFEEIYANYQNDTLRARDIMKTDVATLCSSDTLSEILVALNTSSRGYLPVLSEGTAASYENGGASGNAQPGGTTGSQADGQQQRQGPGRKLLGVVTRASVLNAISMSYTQEGEKQ